ncbi:Hypothetical predicted protein [Octopus vulgaris]|uniref:Uncharacterized protein n=1 Tax=Octopus vulgaris TaxID=6645 RepID=A0AA36FMC4_OCTVU|nr:Hypothetical predicted protein [Octopus vulgaris]
MIAHKYNPVEECPWDSNQRDKRSYDANDIVAINVSGDAAAVVVDDDDDDDDVVIVVVVVVACVPVYQISNTNDTYRLSPLTSFAV